MKDHRYSIKDLENFTQIKAHTIRIWEQRYQLLQPKRTETNIRYYDDSDLKKILNINLLYNNGLKISKIAALGDKGILRKAREIVQKTEHEPEVDLDRLILAILEFDQTTLIEHLEEAHNRIGLTKQYHQIIIPLLRKIGELWQVDTLEIVHEHFFSNLYREFLLAKINQLGNSENHNGTVVLFLHEKEQHEFILLLFYYVFKKAGYRCVYLGQNLPIRDVEMVAQKIKPDVFVTTFIAKLKEKEFSTILEKINALRGDARVLISGSQVEPFLDSIPETVEHVRTIWDLDYLIATV